MYTSVTLLVLPYTIVRVIYIGVGDSILNRMTQKTNTSDNSTEIEMSVEKQWTTRGGEGTDHHAVVTVFNDDYEVTYKMKNIFDFGFQMSQTDSIAYIEEDDWLDVRVEVQETWNEEQDSIAQKGVLKDLEGMDENEIEFVNWEKSDLPELEEGEEYVLEGVVVNEFDGDQYLSLNSATDVQRVTEEWREFDEQARAYARENSPIPTGVRM